MRVLLSLLLLSLVTAIQAASIEKMVLQEWEEFKLTYNKNYEGEEDSFRMRVFVENKQTIAKHNELFTQGLSSFSMGINQFGDLMTHEFANMMNGLSMNTHSETGVSGRSSYLGLDDDIVLPETVDWRQKGAVTPVKSQGQCGSCWAFSTTGSLEGQHFLKSKKLVSLSEQNLLDCSGSFGNKGCDGGLMDRAFNYIKANGGIDTEASYPYQAVAMNCTFNKTTIGATDTGFVDITSGDETALKQAVATVGPISIAIDAGHQSFQHYQSGVYIEPSCSPTRLDHGVLVVGYGVMNGTDYWLVKNSWSLGWGDLGYIKMARNHGNMCGVATMASYPLV